MCQRIATVNSVWWPQQPCVAPCHGIYSLLGWRVLYSPQNETGIRGLRPNALLRWFGARISDPLSIKLLLNNSFESIVSELHALNDIQRHCDSCMIYVMASCELLDLAVANR